MIFRANTSKSSLIYIAVVLCLAVALCVAATAEKADDAAPVRTTNLHQWGAVTLFHGLPSDRVRAIAQDGEGVMWFGTDAGLAKHDGRRTQTVADAALASRRVLALRFDGAGALWIGTDAGALRMTGERFEPVAETEGKTVTAIAVAPEGGRVVLATSAGVLFDCRTRAEDVSQSEFFRDEDSRDEGSRDQGARSSLDVRVLPERPLTGGGADKSAPLELTSVAIEGESVLVGTRGRGVVRVEGGAATEVAGRPRVFYVETLERDAGGRVWLGAQTTAADSGLFDAGRLVSDDGAHASFSKLAAGATGTVAALKFDARGDMWAGTDGQGVFRFRGAQRLERFTFEGTAGGLRSNRVYSIFVDREGVAWFGTDRGVCRYDPHGVRNETVAAADAESNFVRVLFQTSGGKLLAGTNRGLFVRPRDGGAAWRAVEGMTDKTVYAIAETARGMVLVGASSGLYVGAPASSRAAGDLRFAPEEKPRATDATTQATPDADAATGTRDDPPAPVENDAATPAKTPDADAKKKTAERPKTTAAPAVGGNMRAIAMFQGATFIASYGRGVERLDGDGFQRRTPVWPPAEADPRTREVISLHADPAGKLWIGTARAGVFFFDGQQTRTDAAFAELADTTVRSMSGTTGTGGALWLATARGLYVYRGGKLTAVAPDIDARDVTATGAFPSSDTRPASSASGAGDSISTNAGDPSNTPLASSPQAWCATRGDGLLRVMLDEQFGAVVARLDAEQGLASQNAFAVLPLRPEVQTSVEEALLIGTSRGIARYEPGRVPPVLRAARVTASRTYAPDEISRGVRLDHPQNGLVLDVSATSTRTFPEQFQYAFLLRDAKGEIIRRKLARDAQFQIEDLKPGAYRVEARAFSNDLVASDALAFDIGVARAPFPWTTTALSVLLLLALVALTWGTWQNRKIARTGAALAQVNRQLAAARLQLANETEAERRRIARDLHDQTLADLRRLLLLADEMPTEDAATSGGNSGNGRPPQPHRAPALDPPMLRAEIESISNEIRRICEDLSPSVLENAGFSAALEWALAERVAHLPADCKFAYEFTCDEDIEERLDLPRGVQMQIYRIVQEAVSNVCRHAAATRVRLAVSVTDSNDFLLELEDDGRGFDPRNKKARLGRGLANIRARASIIEAQAHWHKRPDGGTTFTLRKSNVAAPNSTAIAG